MTLIYGAVISNAQISDAQITVVDSLGRTLSFESPPNTVISLSPSITEILAFLGELDKVIGADSQSISSVWYMNASHILSMKGAVDVGGYWWSAIKIEDIMKLRPDVVLADRGAHLPLLKVFDEYNIKVLYLNGGSSNSFNDILSDIELVATVFGKEGRLDSFIEDADRAFSKARETVISKGERKVLVVIGIYGGIWVAGKGTFIDDVITRTGLINAARTFSWSVVNIEKIMEWDPDIILVTPMGITEDVIKESGLDVFKDKMFILNDTEADIILRPGPTIVYSPEVFLKYYNLSIEETPTITVREEKRLLPETALIPGIFVLALFMGLVLGRFLWKRT